MSHLNCIKLLLLTLITCVSLHSFAQDTTEYTVKFSSGKSGISKAQIRRLDSVISQLSDPVNSFVYYIQGHTDNIGGRSYNVRLSEKRCRSIKDYLVEKGVQESRIAFEEYGYDAPVADNDTETGRADNRRTTLTIITKIPPPDWTIEAQLFPVNLKAQTIITTKNGCRIVVPEGAFKLPDVASLPAKIELEVVEYNNPAYFIASGIPMSYNAADKLFMFHSEEMLRIKAYSGSTLLELKDSVKITLNCRKVDSLYETGFYKFNLKEERLFEEEKPKARVEAVIEKAKPEKTPDAPLKETKPAENTTKEPAAEAQKKEQGQPIAEEEKKPGITEKEEPPVVRDKKKDDLKIKEPPLDTGYISLLPKIEEEVDSGSLVKYDTLLQRCLLFCAGIPAFISNMVELTEQPIDLSGNYFEKRFADLRYSGVIRMDPKDRLTNKKYYPIKLVTKKQFLRRRAIVAIKFDRGKNPELRELKKVKWVYRFRNNTEDYASFKKRRFSDIRINYDPSGNSATVQLKDKDQICSLVLKPKDPDRNLKEKMRMYRKVLARRKYKYDTEEHNRMLSLYSCLWRFDKAQRPGEDNFKEWVKQFNSHLPEIHARFDSLNNHMAQLMAGLNCVGTNSCILKWDSIPKEFLKGSGPDRILIIGLGLYNYDNVISMDDVVYIPNVEFRDSNGKKIVPREAFVVLGGLNGTIRADKTSLLRLFAPYKNTLFIVDKANRRYKLVIEAKDVRKQGSVFTLENITETTRTLKELEKELGVNIK